MRAIKRSGYFYLAAYFAFWASIYLRRWEPTIVVVTGSSGKTTLLHLFEAQLGSRAKYSHKANSAFGIPFNILGLERKSYHFSEWLIFILLAPFRAFRLPFEEKIYIAECDAERPYEGEFLAKLLKPNAVVWLSLEEAHGVNFDRVVKNTGTDPRDAVRKAMAREFGCFIRAAKDFCIINADNDYINTESKDTKAKVISLYGHDIREFSVSERGVRIETASGVTSLPCLIPRAAALSVLAASLAVEKLGASLDPLFLKFVLPAGRSSLFKGVRNTVIIDSSYNATMDGVRSMLDLVAIYPTKGELWLVLGDMIEQGKSEEVEHVDLARIVIGLRPDRIITVGPRLQKYSVPLIVDKLGKEKVAAYLMPREALEYLERELKGGETLFFKGARYLEGVIERLLADPADIGKLCRREAVYAAQRKKWNI